MARMPFAVAGLLLAGAALASPVSAGDYGYGPPPTGRAIAPFDAPYAGPGYEPAYGPAIRPVRTSVRPVPVYQEIPAVAPAGPYVVTLASEPIIGRGLLYNTPPTPDAYASGALRVRY